MSPLKYDETGTYGTFRKEYTKKDIGELSDPQRKNMQVISNDDVANIKLDLYLFGKGADINS